MKRVGYMSSNNDFQAQMERKVRKIEEILQEYLPRQRGYQSIIMEAMSYSLLAGGKRLRPMLMMEAFRLYNGSSKALRPFMAAIEMIHTYPLALPDDYVEHGSIQALRKETGLDAETMAERIRRQYESMRAYESEITRLQEQI